MTLINSEDSLAETSIEAGRDYVMDEDDTFPEQILVNHVLETDVQYTMDNDSFGALDAGTDTSLLLKLSN